MADYESKSVEELLRRDLKYNKNVERLVILKTRPQNMREIFKYKDKNGLIIPEYKIGTWKDEKNKKHDLHFYLVPKNYVNIEKIDKKIQLRNIGDTDRGNEDTGINEWLSGKGQFNQRDVPTFSGFDDSMIGMMRGGKKVRKQQKRKKKIFLSRMAGEQFQLM